MGLVAYLADEIHHLTPPTEAQSMTFRYMRMFVLALAVGTSTIGCASSPHIGSPGTIGDQSPPWDLGHGKGAVTVALPSERANEIVRVTRMVLRESGCDVESVGHASWDWVAVGDPVAGRVLVVGPRFQLEAVTSMMLWLAQYEPEQGSVEQQHPGR